MNRRSRVPALLMAALLLLGWAIQAQARSAQEIARRAFGATVVVVLEDASGKTLSLGTGFFVREGEVASSLHVVEGAERGYVKPVGRQATYDIEGVTAFDPVRDLVLLKVSTVSLPTLPLGDSDEVQVGESVYAAGNPQGLEGTFSQGIVSSIREVGPDKLLQITAPISPGSSGGPVFNEQGDVIGVAVATVKNGQNLNFAIPSNSLGSLIEKAGLALPLAQAGQVRPLRSIWKVWVSTARRASPGGGSHAIFLEPSSLPGNRPMTGSPGMVGRDLDAPSPSRR